MKKILFCLFIITILISIPFYSASAAISDPVNLRLVTSRQIVQVGEEFTIDLFMDSPVREVTAAEILVKFPGGKFSILDVQVDETLNQVLGFPEINDESGTIRIKRGNEGLPLFKGQGGKVAIITAKALVSGTTAQVFSIDSNGTRIAGKNTGTTNLKGTMTSTSIRVDSRTFTSALTGASESPPNSSAGTGTATIKISSQSVFSITMNFSGLEGTQTSAHIHGPADPGQNADVLYTLPTGLLTNHTYQSSRLVVREGLSVEQLIEYMQSGKVYVNIHTSAYQEGELRAHIAPELNMPTSPTPTFNPPPEPFLGDLVGEDSANNFAPDGDVDINDFTLLIGEFNSSPPQGGYKADIIGEDQADNYAPDGDVDINDFTALLSNFR